MQATSEPDEFARRIADAGYSTDPAYASKLIGLMLKYDLYRFDRLP
jgi:flagellum-specific peptidoglycan hydrolase FlgJ